MRLYNQVIVQIIFAQIAKFHHIELIISNLTAARILFIIINKKYLIHPTLEKNESIKK
jgi:hypothetical protein